MSEFVQAIREASDMSLAGKTVTKVTYNSETSITIVLSGTTKAAGGENALGCITVKHSGLESSGSSSCLVKVLAPEVRVTSMSSSQSTKEGSTVYRITASLSLPGGEFTERAVNGGITLADGVTGELSVTLSEGHLSVTVAHCSVSAPSLVIDAGATTVGKGTTLRLTVGGKAAFS